MKKVLLLAILVTSSLFAQAQKSKKSPEERAQARVDKISQELNLTDTQKQEIYTLFLSEGNKGKVEGKNIRNLNAEERQAYINARKDEKAAVFGKIAEILDEDQLATFQAMEKPGRSNPVKAGRGKANGKIGKGKKDSADRIQNRVDKLSEELSLTPEQQTQVKDLFTAQQAAQQARKRLGKDSSEEERTANKEAWRAAKVANEEKMKAILNADQYATFQANKSAKGEKGRRSGKANPKAKRLGGNSVENRVQQLTEKLQLSETQQAQVTTILANQQEARKMKGERTELSEDAKAVRKTARMEAKAKLDAEMKAVLTPEQFATYQMESKRRGKGKGKGKLRGKKIEE